MRLSRTLYWFGASLIFSMGELLVYYGTMMGLACPGCKVNGTWAYTFLPWAGGAFTLNVSGILFFHAANTRQDVTSVIVIYFCLSSPWQSSRESAMAGLTSTGSFDSPRISRAKCLKRELADWPEVFDVCRAKRMTCFNRGGRDESVGYLNSMRERVFFDNRCRRGADALGKRQNLKSQLAERLPDLSGFPLRTRALNEFHEGNDGECAIFGCVNSASSFQVASGRPYDDVCIENHLALRAARTFLPV